MARSSGVKKRYRRLRRLAFLGTIGAAAYAWRQKQLAENDRRYGAGHRTGPNGPGAGHRTGPNGPGAGAGASPGPGAAGSGAGSGAG